jgi:hypothetical protein
MPDFRPRFVKCNDEYHLLTLEDVEYFQANGKWPDNYEEINWEEELVKGDFVSLWEFFGHTPTSEQAYNAVYFADWFGVPVFKKDTGSRFGFTSVNIFPRYWLKEFFNK